MKATIYDLEGNKKKEMDLPKVFETKIREDIALKLYESEKYIYQHPSAPSKEGGKHHSASGTISHTRHDWKGHYGKGISRAPRKTMWRRGTQFFWIGAEVPGARGGRRAHPPRVQKRERKINQNEVKIAVNSAIAATANSAFVRKRYSSFKNLNIKLPIILESVPKKTKDLVVILKKVFGNSLKGIIRQKSVRTGKGKTRGRKYKSNAGAILLTSKGESLKTGIIKAVPVRNIKISDLYPLGRIALFTEKAIEEIGGKA